MVDAGGVDREFAVRGRGPRPQLLLRSARPRSSRTGCGTAIALIEWSGQNLPTESDLDPSRTDGRGQFSPAASRPALVCAACPRMPKTTGSTAVRSPHSMLRTRDAADPEHHSWRYPASIPFLHQRPAIETRSTAGRAVFPSVRLLEGDSQPTPIRSAAERARNEKRWSPAPSSSAITNERRGFFGTSRDPVQFLPPSNQIGGLRRPRRVLG